jgi:lysosomal alpha-mannosidase
MIIPLDKIKMSQVEGKGTETMTCASMVLRLLVFVKSVNALAMFSAAIFIIAALIFGARLVLATRAFDKEEIDWHNPAIQSHEAFRAERRRLRPGDEPLTVHLVPHSHDDVGWLRTIDEYYEERVKHIYDNVVSELASHPDRKFIIVEQAFFSRWFSAASNDVKATFRRLLAEKQLEFVLGGWVMNDEACTTAAGIVRQLSRGHRYLNETFGVRPTYGYQIDPFGHSFVMPLVLDRLGMRGLILNRIHWREKRERKNQRTMEFHWRLDGLNVDMLTHILDNHYSAPGGFDFEYDPPVTDETLPVRARGLALDLIARSHSYPSQNNYLQLIGDDFRWQNAHVNHYSD